MDWPKTFTLALSVLALAAIVVLYGNSIHASIDALRAEAAADRRALRAEAAADRRALRAEAAADRRAHQAAMDTFRQEMLLLAERQARVEGRVEGLRERETAGQ